MPLNVSAVDTFALRAELRGCMCFAPELSAAPAHAYLNCTSCPSLTLSPVSVAELGCLEDARPLPRAAQTLQTLPGSYKATGRADTWSGLPSSTPAQSRDGESHRCAHLAAQLRWRSSPRLRYAVICLVPAPISCRHQHLLPAWVCDAEAAPALTARFSYSFAPDKPLLSTPTDLSAFSFQ